MVFDFELHEAHVGWVCELSDDTKSWEQSVEKEHIERQLENKRGRKPPTNFKVECEIIEQIWAKQT